MRIDQSSRRNNREGRRVGRACYGRGSGERAKLVVEERRAVGAVLAARSPLGEVRRRGRWGPLGPVLAVLAIALMPGAVGAATAATFYVDRGNPACADSGSGTLTQPFCTISAAAAKVTAGQTVQVASGTYPERVVVSSSGTSAAPIVFVAAPGAAVTLNGQANGFYLSSKNWVTISGFTVVNTTDYGIAVNTSSHITLSKNHVSYSGKPISGYTKYGIRLNNVTDSLLSSNITDHNTNAGIGLVSGSTRNEVSGNQSFSNAEGYQRAAAGIHLYSAPGNTIASNVAHDNEDSGINIYPGSTDCVVYDNVTYDNGDHGIDDSFAAGATIVANSVYKNVTAGINVEGQSTGGTLANNISVDNGIKSPRTHSDIRVESGSTAGTTMDHDLIYLTTADTLLIWNSINYTSLAAFQAASGQEAHGIQADPKWSSPGAGDFHLLAESPAIDSADSGATGQPCLDVDGNARADDPATPNTGTGPRLYDDRGAHEYRGDGIAHIIISPASATVSAGGSQSYTAEGFDAANNSLGDVTALTTFSIAPEGTCTGNVCVANAGGSHTVSGNDGGKTATASLAVNYVKNPGFETDLSGWNTSGSGTNITLNMVSGGHTGSWAARLANTGTTTSTFATLQDSPNWVIATTAGTYTGSIWVRSDTAGSVFRLKFQEYSGTALAGSGTAQTMLSTAWQQVSVTYTIKSPDSTLDFQAYVSNPVPGTAFYADDASIVSRSSANRAGAERGSPFRASCRLTF